MTQSNLCKSEPSEGRLHFPMKARRGRKETGQARIRRCWWGGLQVHLRSLQKNLLLGNRWKKEYLRLTGSFSLPIIPPIIKAKMFSTGPASCHSDFLIWPPTSISSLFRPKPSSHLAPIFYKTLLMRFLLPPGTLLKLKRTSHHDISFKYIPKLPPAYQIKAAEPRPPSPPHRPQPPLSGLPAHHTPATHTSLLCPK